MFAGMLTEIHAYMVYKPTTLIVNIVVSFFPSKTWKYLQIPTKWDIAELFSSNIKRAREIAKKQLLADIVHDIGYMNVMYRNLLQIA